MGVSTVLPVLEPMKGNAVSGPCLPGRCTLRMCLAGSVGPGAGPVSMGLPGVLDIDVPEVKFLDRLGIPHGRGALLSHVR